MEKNIIKKIIIISLIMLLTIIMYTTNVQAETRNITGDTYIVVVDAETGNEINKIDQIAKDQSVTVGTEEREFSGVRCIEIENTLLKRTGNLSTNRTSTQRWFIPINVLQSDEDGESSGGATGGYGSEGAYGMGTVIIEEGPGTAQTGGGLKDLTQEPDIDSYENYAISNIKGTDGLTIRGNVIVGVLQGVGTVIAVIILTIIGIRYMISSVEERADYKETMVPFVIGAGSLLIISNLVGIIYSIVTNINV